MNKFVSIIILAVLPLVVHAVENEALQGKRFGVEVNPLALLTFGQIFSGTFSFFDTQRNVEIALPIFHEAIGIGRSDELTRTTIDAHYRQFLGDSLNGFYVSGFARAARLRGRTGDDPSLISQPGGQYETVSKLGVGVGIGYRIFLKNGYYWGASMSVGHYLVGENNKFGLSNLVYADDRARIGDIELFKFGYAF